MDITKAQKQLAQGKKITHSSFYEHEYVYMENKIFLDENDYVMKWDIFWKYRCTDSWLTDWKIWSKV